MLSLEKGTKLNDKGAEGPWWNGSAMSEQRQSKRGKEEKAVD